MLGGPFDPTLLTQEIWNGESYMVGNSSYDTPGMYADTLVSEAGCDSVVLLNLLVVDSFRSL